MFRFREKYFRYFQEMEKLAQNQWTIYYFPTFSNKQIVKSWHEIIKATPDKYFANELRKRGYIVIKPEVKPKQLDTPQEP